MLGRSLIGSRVAVLGLAFKPHSDDLRDSPALDIAGRLFQLGAHVVATDPAAVEPARSIRPMLTFVDTATEALGGADLVMLLTEWPEYLSLDPVQTREPVRQTRILDGRNVLDPRAWAQAGWTYRGMGRSSTPNQRYEPAPNPWRHWP